MGDKPKNRALIEDFPGMVSNADAADLDDGQGVEQVNILSAVAGELRTRPGYQPVVFEN